MAQKVNPLNGRTSAAEFGNVNWIDCLTQLAAQLKLVELKPRWAGPARTQLGLRYVEKSRGTVIKDQR